MARSGQSALASLAISRRNKFFVPPSSNESGDWICPLYAWQNDWTFNLQRHCSVSLCLWLPENSECPFYFHPLLCNKLIWEASTFLQHCTLSDRLYHSLTKWAGYGALPVYHLVATIVLLLCSLFFLKLALAATSKGTFTAARANHSIDVYCSAPSHLSLRPKSAAFAFPT